MSHYQFDLDLRAGHSFEVALAKLFEIELGAPWDIKLHDGPEYDIYLMNPHGVESRIECKRDLMAEKTGNIAIEYMSRRQKSGILTTEADCWCFLVGKNVYSVMTEVLRHMFEQGDFKRVRAGDNKTCMVMLVPLCTIKHWSLTKESLYDGLWRRELVKPYYL